MTFTEAAYKVMENEGRPMHSREIAEKAVEQGILSHVGKTPVQTMSARLSAAVAKGDSPFVRISPGVFALAIWKRMAPKKKNDIQETQARINLQAPLPLKDQIIESPVKELEQSDNFKDHLSQGANKANDVESASKEVQQQKRKKRRRRKRRGEESDAPSILPASILNGKPDVCRNDTQERPRNVDILDRIESMIRKSSHPMQVDAIAKEMGRSDDNAKLLLNALLFADGVNRRQKGLRPRFVKHRSGYALLEKQMSAEILGIEKQIAEVIDKLCKITEKQILRKLRNTSMSSFVHAITLYLQRLGFEAMVPVSRSESNGFHMSMQAGHYAGRPKTAAVLRRDPVDQPLLDREVMDLRGALHHYNAVSGLIITTGIVSDKAKQEANVSNTAPIVILDGETLAHEMIKHGIGLGVRKIDLPLFDESVFSEFEA